MARDQDDHARGERGISDLTRSILDHGSDYAEARIELAKLESEETADHVRGLTIRLGIGAFAATVGYAVCLIAAVSFLADYLKCGWEIPALIAGVIHLAIGGLFLLGARRQAKQIPHLFSSTRRELNKDLQWLKQKSTNADHDEPARN